MAIDSAEDLGNLLKILSGWKRLKAFDLLAEGHTTTEVAEEIDLSRSGLQPYLDDYRDADLVERTADGFTLTERGEMIHEWLEELDDRYVEFAYDQLDEAARTIKSQEDEVALSSGQQQVLRELLERAEADSEDETG